jgi:hypothetical protein
MYVKMSVFKIRKGFGIWVSSGCSEAELKKGFFIIKDMGYQGGELGMLTFSMMDERCWLRSRQGHNDSV